MPYFKMFNKIESGITSCSFSIKTWTNNQWVTHHQRRTSTTVILCSPWKVSLSLGMAGYQKIPSVVAEHAKWVPKAILQHSKKSGSASLKRNKGRRKASPILFQDCGDLPSFTPKNLPSRSSYAYVSINFRHELSTALKAQSFEGFNDLGPKAHDMELCLNKKEKLVLESAKVGHIMTNIVKSKANPAYTHGAVFVPRSYEENSAPNTLQLVIHPPRLIVRKPVGVPWGDS